MNMMYLLCLIIAYFGWIANKGYIALKERSWALFSLCVFFLLTLLYHAGYYTPIIAHTAIGSVMLAGHLLEQRQRKPNIIAAILAVCFWPFAFAYIKSKREVCEGES